MIAKEKFPKSGIFRYHSKFVGKSHKKSDNGPIKPNTPLIASKIDCIKNLPLSIIINYSEAISKILGPEQLLLPTSFGMIIEKSVPYLRA